uniref:Uncharacterized protein n=1 Tax=Arcella intermedia TaxID=1963864 RepID=A0A6B2LCT3_9EUKA
MESIHTLDLKDQQYISHLRLQSSGKDFKQFRRLTLHVEEEGQLNALHQSSPIFSQYDIIAVSASNETLLKKCIDNGDVDIISFDFSQKISYPLRNKVISNAINKGIHFEILYSKVFGKKDAQALWLRNALHLVRISRGKNIILSSGAKDPLDLRGPYDVSNLSCMFGLEVSNAKHIVSTNCRSVLLHAEARKVGRGAFVSVPLNQLSEEQHWMVPEFSQIPIQKEEQKQDQKPSNTPQQPNTQKAKTQPNKRRRSQNKSG